MRQNPIWHEISEAAVIFVGAFLATLAALYGAF